MAAAVTAATRAETLAKVGLKFKLYIFRIWSECVLQPLNVILTVGALVAAEATAATSAKTPFIIQLDSTCSAFRTSASASSST